MIEFIAGWFVVGAAVTAFTALSVHLAPRTPRPRHARPKGWTGPAERAPFPLVADLEDDAAQALRVVMERDGTQRGISHLNREIMRRRFRVMWWQSQGRPVV